MVDERPVFSGAIEGLFLRSLGDGLSPMARERLRQAGLDLSKPLLPAYPAATWSTCVQIAAEDVSRSRPLSLAVREMGALEFDGFTVTLLGGPMLALLKVIGVRRALLRLAINMGKADTFAAPVVSELAPTDFRITLADAAGVPEFYAGILERGVRQLGAPGVRVEFENPEPPGCVIRIRW